MSADRKPVPNHHGYAPVGITRYFALYAAQLGWIVLGLFLYSRAYWPSSCRPHDVMEVMSCSSRLADQRGWIESALMTWLWSTPLLVALELMRWYNRFKGR